jgi:cytochrome c oxidase subunit 3
MAEMSFSTASPRMGEKKFKNENQKLAMWLYLASEVVIFAVMIAGYIIYRLNEPTVIRDVHKELGIALVTANTFILLASSYAMVMGLRAMEMGNRQQSMMWIGATVVMGIAFLGGQWLEYQELAHLEITLQDTSSAFAGFGMRFYAPTFFHGAHVFVGVLLGLRVLWLSNKGHYDNNPIGIEIFGLYWHFVDVVWIMLFTLIYLV